MIPFHTWIFREIKTLAATLSIQGEFPGGSDSKESTCNAGNVSSIPGSGTSPGEGNGNPFQYSCLENSMDSGVWRATVHGVGKVRRN